MSWVDKELKKRTNAVQHSNVPPSAPVVSESQCMATLWEKIDGANNALPVELRLAVDFDLPANLAPDGPKFLVWLRAPNGAGLGFSGDGIRYVWPEINVSASYNFWIRWTPGRGFRLHRRVLSQISGPKVVERSFNDQRAEYMIKCLVTGRRVKPRDLRRKRLWLF